MMEDLMGQFLELLEGKMRRLVELGYLREEREKC